MLVLHGHIGEIFFVGEDIEVTVISVVGSKIKIGITAPKEVSVDREEIRKRKNSALDALGFPQSPVPNVKETGVMQRQRLRRRKNIQKDFPQSSSAGIDQKPD